MKRLAVHVPVTASNFWTLFFFDLQSLELAACMLGLAAEAKARQGIIEPALYDELQYAYECRLINTVTLHPGQKEAQTIPIYELFSPKVS